LLLTVPSPSPLNKDTFCGCLSADLHPGREYPQSTRPKGDKRRGVQELSGRALAAKKARGACIPCEGDWKCGACGFWNNGAWDRCLRDFGKTSRRACGVRKDSTEVKHQVQEPDYGVSLLETGAKFFGDWFCGVCRWWCKHVDQVCFKCARSQEDCKVGEDWDEYIPYWNEPGAVTSRPGDFLNVDGKHESGVRRRCLRVPVRRRTMASRGSSSRARNHTQGTTRCALVGV
jgi:hypothetical protein